MGSEVRIKFLRLVLVLTFIISDIFPLAREKPLLLPADILGAGGTGITAYDKFGIYFLNPASFGVTEKEFFSLLRTGFRINYDVYEYYSAIQSVVSKGGDLSSLTYDEINSLNQLVLSFGINGPLGFGYMTEGIGFLFYNDFHSSLATYTSGILPYVDFGSYFDLVFLCGIGRKFTIPLEFGKLITTYAGINIKYINRLKYENPRLSILKAYDLFMSGFKEGFLWGQAIGSDLGLLLNIENFYFGLTVKDWFNTFFSWNAYNTNFQIISNRSVEPTYYPATFNIGMSYKLSGLVYGISQWVFYFDINDVFGFEENYFLKLRFGTEVKFLKIFVARMGLYKGYPTLGFGLEIPVLNINFAYYTEELGKLPGLKPQQNFVLELQILL